MKIFRKKKKIEISFDEILLDSSNLPSFDLHRMEGRIELPLSKRSIYAVALVFLLIATAFSFKLFSLQVIEGATFAAQSKENSISQTLIIAERGTVYDRNGEMLAWNELNNNKDLGFPMRAYTDRRGLGQLIGYVSYPKKDSSGFYYRTEYIGRSGIEEAYNELLEGENGEQFVEVNAHGEIISENVIAPALPGDEITLSIDAELTEHMYDIIASSTTELGFRSGGAAIMNVETGELIAMTSFPSYDPEVLSDGDDAAAIAALNDDNRFPFLNKIMGGVYTPGSIVKPFVAYGALAENIIDPMKIIVSNGYILVPNPYNPSNPSRFNDWRVQGKMTMRDAIAYSSNVYFYTIGGGFGDQPGLGISRLNKYFHLFGLGEETGIVLNGEVIGTVPNPEWKQENFNDDWRLGDTYFTSIGQYGFLVTPLQMLRAYSAIANGGKLLTPMLEAGEQGDIVDLNLNMDDVSIVRDGMRHTVIQDGGTARALERSDVKIAAKSGTAELDASNAHVNSWIAGYFPYEHPKYAFILFMEHGPYKNTLGAGRVMGWVFDWMAEHRPEYLQDE